MLLRVEVKLTSFASASAAYLNKLFECRDETWDLKSIDSITCTVMALLQFGKLTACQALPGD